VTLGSGSKILEIGSVPVPPRVGRSTDSSERFIRPGNSPAPTAATGANAIPPHATIFNSIEFFMTFSLKK